MLKIYKIGQSASKTLRTRVGNFPTERLSKSKDQRLVERRRTQESSKWGQTMKECTKCKQVKRFEAFNLNKSKKDGYSTECRGCIKLYADAYRRKNKEALLLQSREFKAANRETINLKNRERYLTKRLDKDFMLRKREASSRYKSANKGKVNSDTAKRHCAKMNRTSITTKADFLEIREIYQTARAMSSTTGTVHHVDHIVPLQGELVSGLHIPSNLQILTEIENCSKHNTFIV